MKKRIILAYFSGTGCTKAVCDCFEEQLLALGVEITKINMAENNLFDAGEASLLIIFSPVYAFRLSSIAETWVKNLPKTNNASVAIISVSGGGEISPNTACGLPCKKLLKRKGYNLIYEKMLVMPSNFAVQAERKLNLRLLTVLPDKVNQIVQEILSGKQRIVYPKLIDRFFVTMGKAEHIGARFFGKSIKASWKCNKCGKCISNCPKKNIRMINGLPKFGFSCIWCLKCIYYCPSKALSPRILKFVVLKEGFDLTVIKEMALKEGSNKENLYQKNILWQGVIDYLSQRN